MRITKSKPVKVIILAIAIIITGFSITSPGVNFWTALLKTAGVYGVPAVCDDYSLNVHFISVDKADSILIEHNGEFVLIDGATYDKKSTVESYLEKCGVKSLSAIIASHLDKDHIGSLSDIIQDYNVSKIYMSKYPDEILPSSDEYKLLMLSIEDNSCNLIYERAGDSFKEAGIEFSVLSPGVDYDNSNDMSLVLRASCDSFSALFTGDASKNIEKWLLSEKASLKSDILKVAHHGSNDSSSEEFLKAVSPLYSVISCGDGDGNLPGYKCLARLDDLGGEILRTDKIGNIVISTNCDGKYTVSKEK